MTLALFEPSFENRVRANQRSQELTRAKKELTRAKKELTRAKKS